MAFLKKYLLKIIGALVILVLIFSVSVILFIKHRATPNTYTDINTIPHNHVGVVFGALVHPDGTLSPILHDRVQAGVLLYQNHKVDILLMTGDNSSSHYDEVTAMKNYAISAGVPESAIVLDYAGFDTYQSCYRAQAIFGLTKATLITQRYHLPRALFACRSLGIDAIGLALPDFELYPDLRFSYTAREYAADVKAWWQLEITHPKPTFLGQPLPIGS